MIRQFVFAAALLGLAPGILPAQQGEEAARRIAAAEARLEQSGIPADMLRTKIAEGKAKGVAEERIAAAIERRAAGLIRAQQALAGSGERFSAAEIAAGADALGAGADANSIRAVVQQARSDEAPVALAVLGELVKQGLPVDQARARVESALEQGGDALANLPRQATEARARRGAPESVGGRAAKGRPSGVGNAPSGTPAGRPSGLPTPGSRPGAGAPAGNPAGKPAGTPGGRP